MIVLDAYVVLALLRGEPAAERARRLVASPDSTLTALGVAEVIDHLLRLMGVNEDEAVLDLAQLGLLPGTNVGTRLAMAAGVLRAGHYHRKDRAVSLADCVAAETARTNRCVLATADAHLLDLCHHEGIDVEALPASGGATWSAPPRPDSLLTRRSRARVTIRP